MKKSYIAPSCKIRLVKKCNIIATSGGVKDGDNVNRSFNRDDVSYGRGWDDDDWDED